MAVDKLVDSAQLDGDLASVANAIRSKGGTSAQLSFPSGMVSAVDAIPTKQAVSWNQCPQAVKNFISNVTYDTDYTYSHVQEYAPTPAVKSNTKPIGKTVDGVTYYNEVPNEATPFVSENAAGSLTPLDRVRWINSVTNNFRDLGGWACDGGTVKYGLLFRSGELNAADADLVKNRLGISTELGLTGDGIPGEITGLRYVGTSDGSYAMYALTPVEAWKINLRAVFDAAKYREPLVFHCAAGADRTGTLACIIEGILGVSQSDCDKDYELTSFYSERRRDRDYQGGGGADWRRLIGQITALSGSTFRDKCVNFVASLGFTAAEINAFRSAMIDGNPQTVTPSIGNYTITKSLQHATGDNPASAIDQYQDYELNITPDTGYVIQSVTARVNGEDVSISAVSGDRVPYGTVEITENGSHNVSWKAKVDVDVPSVQPTGTININANGTHDVTDYASAVVNVSEGRSKTFDLASRSLRYLYSISGTYAFDIDDATYEGAKYLPTNDKCYITGGRRYHTAAIYNKSSMGGDIYYATVSAITQNGFTFTAAGIADSFILLPYHLKSGETFTISYHRDVYDRSIRIICDEQGRYLSNDSIDRYGGGDTSWTYTATQDCWLYYGFGTYNTGAVQVYTNISITIS